MRLNKLFKFISMLTLVIMIVIVVLSCQTPGSNSSSGSSGSSSDDKDQNDGKELANGIYAKLIVARIATQATGIKMDSIEAIFSKYYDPCSVIPDPRPQPTSVSCSDNAVPKNDYLLNYANNKYVYQQMPPDDTDFLVLDKDHEFKVVGSTEVPSLTKSIILPADEPTITAPLNNASISKNNDNDITWLGNTIGGNVVIVVISTADPSMLVSVETEDDGIYTFIASQLSSLSNGQYYLHVERFNEEFITATGYDNRSIIRGRLLCSIFINLTD